LQQHSVERILILPLIKDVSEDDGHLKDLQFHTHPQRWWRRGIPHIQKLFTLLKAEEWKGMQKILMTNLSSLKSEIRQLLQERNSAGQYA